MKPHRIQPLSFIASGVAGIVLLVACSSEPLTAAECRTLIEKEIEFATHTLPPDEAQELGEYFRQDIGNKVSTCIGQDQSSRKYYSCMTNAESMEKIKKCINNENARNRI